MHQISICVLCPCWDKSPMPHSLCGAQRCQDRITWRKKGQTDILGPRAQWEVLSVQICQYHGGIRNEVLINVHYLPVYWPGLEGLNRTTELGEQGEPDIPHTPNPVRVQQQRLPCQQVLPIMPRDAGGPGNRSRTSNFVPSQYISHGKMHEIDTWKCHTAIQCG